MLLDDRDRAPTQPMLAQVWRPVFSMVPVRGSGSLEVRVRAEPVGKVAHAEVAQRPVRHG